MVSLRKQLEQLLVYDCNPGGNHTYIAYGTKLKRENYGYLDQAIRTLYPHFEQGGFIESPTNKNSVLRLHMAGGEFCGNAVRCLAALIIQDISEGRKLNSIANYSFVPEASQRWKFSVEISGIDKPIDVDCFTEGQGYMVKAEMPFRRCFSNISEKQIIWQGQQLNVTLVQMQGITHILIDETTFSFILSSDKWKSLIDTVIDQFNLQEESAIGLIWYSSDNSTTAINPVVWVRNINTCIYESACGSGTLALALNRLKHSSNEFESYEIEQPSGAKIKVAASKSSSQFTSATIEGYVSLKFLPSMYIPAMLPAGLELIVEMGM